MPIVVLRLGSPRTPNEGLRLGTVRRPPRGVPKTQFVKLDFYDVWLPNLAPSQELVAFGQRSQDEQSWKAFQRKIRAETARPDRTHYDCTFVRAAANLGSARSIISSFAVNDARR